MLGKLDTSSAGAKQTSCVPDIFCWTKMGTEAGQTLGTILRRKELERQAGSGIFAWGIGNSLGASPALAVNSIDKR
jgi:4-aminobutyrate aminotransferase-like enzyme